MPRRVDVVIVGAGLAGLSAARRLIRHGQTVVVLEARDRVGGRTLTQTVGGIPVDLGAQWVGPQQTRVLELAHELGVTTFQQYDDGSRIFELAGRRPRLNGVVPRLAPHALLEAQLMIRRIDAMQRSVPVDAPWTSHKASAWDAVTLEAWKRRNVLTKGARAVLDVAVRAIFAAEPVDLSLLFFLFYVRAGGSLYELAGVRGGAQEQRFTGGAQQLSQRMAEGLAGSVVLDAAVTKIADHEDGLHVTSAKGTWHAPYAIVAMSPALAAHVEFSPALPEARGELHRSMPMGAVIKCLAVYERPFWRDRGLAGEVASDASPLSPVFDASPPDDSRGVLAGFFEGDAARERSGRSAGERQATVVQELVRYFGAEAGEPIDYADADWPAEKWSGGGYAGIAGPGVLTRCGPALREPCGRIHWAGTETATRWAGYMDGAVSSGERAAAEVIERLDTQVAPRQAAR